MLLNKKIIKKPAPSCLLNPLVRAFPVGLRNGSLTLCLSQNVWTNFWLPFLWQLRMSFRLYSGGVIGLLIGLLEKDPSLSLRNHTLQNEERYFPCKLQDSPFPYYILSLLFLPCLHCIMTWTQISFVLHLQMSGRSNVSSSSTLSYALFWKDIITAHNSKQCGIYPDTAGFAVFMFKMCSKPSELSVTEII
jgi:hypothetical protein